MSQVLSVRLSDEVFATVRERAAECGTSPAEFISTTLERQFGPNGKTKPDAAAERNQLRTHFGVLNMVSATSVDNERIDVELAREYENPRENP